MCEVLLIGPDANQFREVNGAVSGSPRGLPWRRNQRRDRVLGA
jgi:hypothetical protein